MMSSCTTCIFFETRESVPKNDSIIRFRLNWWSTSSYICRLDWTGWYSTSYSCTSAFTDYLLYLIDYHFFCNSIQRPRSLSVAPHITIRPQTENVATRACTKQHFIRIPTEFQIWSRSNKISGRYRGRTQMLTGTQADRETSVSLCLSACNCN